MKILLQLALLFGLNNGSAQFINGDFEQWDTISMFGQPYIDPASWDSNNNNDFFGIANTPVTRGGDSIGYYARIESNAYGIDASLPGKLKQTILSHNLNQITYDYKCDSIFQAGSCVVNIYKGSSNTLFYTDSLFAEDIGFQSKTIDILPDWNLQHDFITIEFVAKGNIDDWDEQKDGHSVFLIDKVTASYISSLEHMHTRENILVFPNPSNGEVFVTIKPSEQACYIQDISHDGGLVYASKTAEGIRVQNLLPGFYYVKCTIRNEAFIQPIVVIK